MTAHYSPWLKNQIETTWPAVRLLGPNVDVCLAEEYIWRTDHALSNPHFCCNDEEFSEELSAFLGYERVDFVEDPEGYREAEDAFARAVELRGQFRLEHLGSDWVATCYADGPNGPVHPNGEVRLHKNFGKRPTVEEIESDLDKLAREFPWLSFKMALWEEERPKTDDPKEIGELVYGNALVDSKEPEFAWWLDRGRWQRTEPVKTELFGVAVPREMTLEHSCNTLYHRDSHDECAWSMHYIKRMWGDAVKDHPVSAGKEAS